MSYAGTIKHFDMAKGWGHIECEVTQQLYGKDIILLRSQLHGASVAKGDPVNFDVVDGQKGAEAANVHVVSSVQSHLGGFVGNVKSFNPEKGWGHISCELTERLYGKDIFLMKSAIPGGHAQIGDRVSFSVKDGQKGPEASNVTFIATKDTPSVVANPQRFQGSRTGSYTGSVKKFDEQKGWGHISCDATYQLYGKDMFFMRSALHGQTTEAGDRVRFTVSAGLKGPEAQNVSVLSKANGMQAAAPLFSGQIKNWNEEKGWGFIACQDTHNMYGKDIFLHKKELLGQLPIPGSPVQFSVTVGEDGRAIASTVVLNQLGGGYQPARQTVAPGTHARPSPY